MPTASVKQEKQAPPEDTSSIRQGIVIVEHKIRNLEKRKAKLETYRDLQKEGKELAKEQTLAVAKYDEVVQTLEFARELAKQFNTLATEHAKNRKKQQRKEAVEKAQHELNLIKEALIIQDVLSSMGQENVREDFTQGKAGIVVTQDELQQLDDLYGELVPKQDGSVSFCDGFQAPAEHLLHLIDGKSKAAFGTTYAALKEKIGAISRSGYFECKDGAAAAPTEGAEPLPDPGQAAQQPAEHVEPEETPLPPNQPTQAKEETVTEVPHTAPPMPEPAQVPSGTFQSNAAPGQEEARAPIDPAFYASSHLSVFKSGPIDFMQDNELDTPEVEASTIPTLTYTNQSYNTPAEAQPTAPEPPQPEPTPYHDEVVEEKAWSTAGAPAPSGGGGDAQIQIANDEWVESTNDESWANQSEQSWSQPQNDGFITAGGRGRGGRGRGGGGDRGNKAGGRGGNRGGGNRGGYNREGGGGYNREGGGGGGYNRDNGYYQNQNGYRERGERGGGRGGAQRGATSDRPTGGRGGRGGGGRGGGGGYRGGGGGYGRQQQ